MTQPEPTPAEIFLHLIVTFLTPMFLTATGGDITYARVAATETVNAYGARTYLDLLPIAQVIAFGLASLDSINRSMNEALATTVVLRLRANATSLNRAAEQCRRALRTPAAQETWPEAELPWAAAPDQTAAETLAPQPGPDPLPATTTQPETPTPATPPAAPQLATTPAPTTTHPATAQPATRTAWATAMTDVAREYTTGLTNLPPSERRQASMRAAALSSVAQHLLSSASLPPSPLSAPFQLPSHRRP